MLPDYNDLRSRIRQAQSKRAGRQAGCDTAGSRRRPTVFRSQYVLPIKQALSYSNSWGNLALLQIGARCALYLKPAAVLYPRLS